MTLIYWLLDVPLKLTLIMAMLFFGTLVGAMAYGIIQEVFRY